MTSSFLQMEIERETEKQRDDDDPLREWHFIIALSSERPLDCCEDPLSLYLPKDDLCFIRSLSFMIIVNLSVLMY